MSATSDPSFTLRIRSAGDLPLMVVEDGATVLVANAPDAPLDRPFFVDSLADLSAAGVRARAVRTTDFINGAPVGEPVGWVFHTARCGSTLLTALLACDPHVLVLREPSPLNVALSPPRPVGPRRPLLRAILGWFHEYAVDRDALDVVKLPSMASLVAGDLVAAFPAIPAVAVIGHPDVMVASMARSPAESLEWLGSNDADRLIGAGLAPIDVALRDRTALRWAALWTSMARMLAGEVERGTIHAITQRALTDDPVGVASDVLERFTATAPTPEIRGAMADVAQRDAKHPERPWPPVTPTPPLDLGDLSDPYRAIVEPGLRALAAAGVDLEDAHDA
jgi:hypothetical protein